MVRWRSKEPERAPEVIERVEPIEIPIITETKRLLARGEYDGALRGAYARVLEDVQRAFSVPFPPGWTTGDILGRGAGPEMGHLPEFLERLTSLYTPLRFGASAPRRDPDELLALLQSIYASRPMWRLYLEPRPAAERDRSPAPPTPAVPARRKEGPG